MSKYDTHGSQLNLQAWTASSYPDVALARYFIIIVDLSEH
jgi:hypothetical protein